MAAHDVEIIVVGGSAGALEVLGTILPALPAAFAVPLAIVVHIPAGKQSLLPAVLGQKCALPVREPEDKEPVAARTVYVAPPNYHLLIEKTRSFALSVDEPVLYSRPSIDVLFESAAEAYGAGVLGVLLTGASEDGARGLVRIKERGGIAVVQAPSTAAVPIMPEAGRHLTNVDRELAPAEIALFLAQLGRADAEVL
jgi:two-component system, chemotaxis family, protein-glutamate methylesterase/glutaminase